MKKLILYYMYCNILLYCYIIPHTESVHQGFIAIDPLKVKLGLMLLEKCVHL